MLRRLGNKTKLLPELLPLFPEHVGTFVDLFLGGGAVTCAMINRADFVFANDNDGELLNVYRMIQTRKDELLHALQVMPVHEGLFKYWLTHEEEDDISRACRFLLLSHFSLYGAASALRIQPTHDKQMLFTRIEEVFCVMQDVTFFCCDFREVLSKLHFCDPEREKPKAFVYSDPPYLDTVHHYHTGFTEQDTRDLFEVLVGSGMRFGISEFQHPVVLSLAEHYDLHITILKERQTLKNRHAELYLSNYIPRKGQLSFFS